MTDVMDLEIPPAAAELAGKTISLKDGQERALVLV